MERAADEFIWLVGNGKGILASLNEQGIASLAIEAGKECPVSGTQMFGRMMARFGDRVNGIQGNWSYGANLATVNRLTRSGVSLDSTAILQAAEGTPGAFVRVQVLFRR